MQEKEKQIIDRKFAFVVDYATLSKLILKDLLSNERYSSFFKKYNKEDVRRFLQNPETYKDQLREISRFLYVASPHYKRLIKHFANSLTFDYIVEPNGLSQKMNKETLKTNYIKTLNLLEMMNLKHEMIKIFIIAFKEDVFYGYEHMTNNSYFIQKLDPQYCQISSIEDGVYNFAFDFSYFDKPNNKKKLEQFPEEFKEKYKEYQKNKTNNRWIELDSENTICIKVNEEIEYPIPPFSGVFEDIFDIVDYKSLKKAKQEVENYKVLVQEIPIRSNSDNINDFLIDLDTAIMFHNKAIQSLPDQVGLITTPMKVTDISFEKDKVGNDNVQEAERDYWNGAGVSQLLFNSDKGGSIGLNRSIQSDEAIMFAVLRQVERWLNRKLKNFTFSSKFKVKFLNTTIYNWDKLFEMYLKAAQYGLPTKTLACASMGISPAEMLNLVTLENDIFELHNSFIPLRSSHTQSSKDTVGRPKKNEDELSEKGLETRDNLGNENRAK